MQTIKARFVRPAMAAAMVVAFPMGMTAAPAQAAPRRPVVAGPTAVPQVGPSVAQAQSCVLRAYRVTRRGAIRGNVRATNCRGWTVWYGMQVHRWHGWTRIAGREAFAGSSGRRTYTVRACQRGTFNYRMYIGRRGGSPPWVQIVNGSPVRRQC